MSDRAVLGGRSAENRDAENNYACMNGSSREQYIWQSPSVLPRTITNAHRSFRFPRLRLGPRELHCCGACCSRSIFADAKAECDDRTPTWTCDATSFPNTCQRAERKFPSVGSTTMERTPPAPSNGVADRSRTNCHRTELTRWTSARVSRVHQAGNRQDR